MKSSKQCTSSGAIEMNTMPSPTEHHRPVTKTKSSTENSLSTVLYDSKDNTNPVELPSTDDGSKPQIPTGHKMSVPSVTVPSVSNRSRLSSFNLPIFANSTKPMTLFLAHKRRGSLGKTLQKGSKASSSKAEVGQEEVIIDMEERSKEIEGLTADASGLIESEVANMDSAMTDVGGSIVAGGGLISPLDITQASTKKSGRQISGSSAAGRVSLPDERQSKISLAESGQKAPDGPQQRSMERSTPDDAADLQRTERSLATLLDDFSAGRLKAFGSSDASFALRRVREMQERLARSHFDLYALQEKIGFDNPKISTLSLANWQSLMAGMQELTEAVHRMGTTSKVSSTDSQTVQVSSEEDSHDRLDTSASVTL